MPDGCGNRWYASEADELHPRLLKDGVSRVHILDGRIAHCLLLEDLYKSRYRHSHLG